MSATNCKIEVTTVDKKEVSACLADFVRQAVQENKIGTALDAVLEHEKAGYITRAEAEEYIKTLAPLIDAMLCEGFRTQAA